MGCVRRSPHRGVLHPLDARPGAPRSVSVEAGGAAGPVSLRDHAGGLGRRVASAPCHLTSIILPLPHLAQPPRGRSLISCEITWKSIPWLLVALSMTKVAKPVTVPVMLVPAALHWTTGTMN